MALVSYTTVEFLKGKIMERPLIQSLVPFVRLYSPPSLSWCRNEGEGYLDSF